MALSDLSIEAIAETDIAQLIADGVQEGTRIEYKRTSYGGADLDKREYLKDATSFANSLGGHLLLGMDAPEGVAASIVPFAGDPDAEILRLESLLRDGVEPRINGVLLRAVPVSGGHVFVIRLPKSWNAPHRVAFRGTNKFYARSSAGAYELGVEELRAKFTASATALDRAGAFREQRLALLAVDEGTVPLARAGGRLTLHIVPLSGTGESVVDLELAATDVSDLLRPVGAAGWSPEFNFDGFANVRSGTEVFGYTQLFRDGSIEATKVRITATHQGVSRIPALDLGNPIMRAVPDYVNALQRLGISPPFAVMITLEGIRGAYLGYSESQWISDVTVIRPDVLKLPPVVISDFGTNQSYQTALKPAFDAIWNAGGLSGCTYFNDENIWQPQR